MQLFVTRGAEIRQGKVVEMRYFVNLVCFLLERVLPFIHFTYKFSKTKTD